MFGTGFSHNTRGFKGIDAFYSELSSRDRVELSELQIINLSEVDIDKMACKLSLLRDTDVEPTSINDSIDKL